MRAFRVEGRMRVGQKLIHWQDFTLEVVAGNEDEAVERVKSEVGSKHRVKRNLIEIKGIKPIKKGEARNPRVIRALEGKK